MHPVNVPASELTEFDLPRVCVVTGQTQGVEFHPVKFSWYPRWVVALVLVNLLVAAIVAQVLTKKVSGKLPFTPEAHAAWKRGKLLYGLSFVAFLVLIGAMIFAAANEALVVSVLCLALAVAAPVATYFAFARHRGPVVERIADGKVTFKLPSAAAAEAIARHLYAGAVVTALPVADPVAAAGSIPRVVVK